MKLAALLTLTLSAAPAPSANDAPAKYEDDGIKAKLKVVTDGKQHFLAFDPSNSYRGPMFYGDGKTFHLLRTQGGGSAGSDQFTTSLWDPRIDWNTHGYASFEWKEGKYSVTCPPKTTELKVVPPEEAKKLLDGAQLFQSRWQRRPHKLARDDKGVYYFVDCAREENARGAAVCERDWRLYVGQRGQMKLQQMTNIVHDSEGEIFSTKTGELRLVLTDDAATGAAAARDSGLKWVAGKVSSPLINVPVEANGRMIYTNLGIYDRERLGTPCDDM